MTAARYGDRVGTLEPYSIEHVPLAERHGRGRDLLRLWQAANLTIARRVLISAACRPSRMVPQTTSAT